MSLKARLASRELPSDEFPLQISDDSQARKDLAAAEYELRLVESRGEDPKSAKAKVKRAQSKLDACYERVTVRALPAEDMEALIAAHPSGDEPWNVTTFRPALLAACVEGDMTEADWAEFCKRSPLGEVRALYQKALKVNDRSPDPAMGKDLAEILNLL